MTSTFWGRKALLAQLDALLSKSDPDNVSVVGPRGMGKTSLLRELARRYAAGKGDFVSACYVDLKHRRLDLAHPVFGPVAEAMQRSLRALGPDNEFSLLADELDPASPNVFNMLRRITIDDLAAVRRPILLALDGCDAVLKSTVAPRAAWDGLCNLADEGGVRFVTGSRRRLGDLCRDDDASSSDFFLRFKQLIELRPIGTDEWGDVFAVWGVDAAKGARDECHGWTGGHPALVAALGETLQGLKPLSIAAVSSSGSALVSRAHDALVGIWKDVGVEGQADLAAIAKSTVHAASFNKKRLDALSGHGLVRQVGGELRCASRAVEMYALEHGTAATDLQRLFGNRELFASNIRQVLEFRSAQIAISDKDLREHLRRALADVEHPRFCLNQFRGLASRALDMLYMIEAPGWKFPAAWLAQWSKAPNSRWPGDKGFPTGDRGRQCQLLREIVDDSKSPRLATMVSRRTAALVDQIKSYGDLGQHLDDTVDGSVAVAACFAALEMCDSLTRDLR
ncbi:MAG: ATP-binding protein [Pseudomonadota bacterium]|nr:ATP-binding protein [Pseudomonadota bacterium]